MNTTRTIILAVVAHEHGWSEADQADALRAALEGNMSDEDFLAHVNAQIHAEIAAEPEME